MFPHIYGTWYTRGTSSKHAFFFHAKTYSWLKERERERNASTETNIPMAANTETLSLTSRCEYAKPNVTFNSVLVVSKPVKLCALILDIPVAGVRKLIR